MSVPPDKQEPPEEPIESGSFPPPFGESAEGPGEEDELAARQAAQQIAEGEEEGGGEDDRATLEGELQDLRGQVGDLTRKLGTQGQELGFYRQRFGAADAGLGAGGFGAGAMPGADLGAGIGGPAFGQQVPGQGDPIATALQQFLVDGNPAQFGATMRNVIQHSNLQTAAGLMRFYRETESTREARRAVETRFFRANPALAEGEASEQFEACRALVEKLMPQASIEEQLAESGRRSTSLLKRMGYKIVEEKMGAEEEARLSHSAPGSGARPASAPAPRSQREISSEHTAQFVKDAQTETARSQRGG